LEAKTGAFTLTPWSMGRVPACFAYLGQVFSKVYADKSLKVSKGDFQRPRFMILIWRWIAARLIRKTTLQRRKTPTACSIKKQGNEFISAAE